MVVDIGEITATATCVHCGGAIHFTRWSLGNDRWMHDNDGRSDRHCPNSPVALPRPGTIIETGN